jgi:hypothetical protein
VVFPVFNIVMVTDADPPAAIEAGTVCDMNCALLLLLALLDTVMETLAEGEPNEPTPL